MCHTEMCFCVFCIIFAAMCSHSCSWYLDHNIQTYCYTPDEVDVEDDVFVESNLMHAVNGFVFANLNEMFMCVDETVHWHTWALGTEVDLHSWHWHGNTLLHSGASLLMSNHARLLTLCLGHRTDVIELLPATMRTLEMTPDNAGNWAAHCHVSDHAPSMTLYFQVAEKDKCDQGIQHWLPKQGARGTGF